MAEQRKQQRKRTQRTFKKGDRVMTTHGLPSRVHKLQRGGKRGDPLYVVLHEDGSGGGIERESQLAPHAVPTAESE